MSKVESDTVWWAYQEIQNLGQLEDRREYDEEMLQDMYDLDPTEAAELYRLIQSNF